MTEESGTQWQAELDRRGWVEFRPERAAAFRMVAFATLMVLLAVVVIATGSAVEAVVGGIAGAIFAICLVVLLIRVAVGLPTVRVDSVSVTCGRQQVRWDEVTEISTWSPRQGKASVVIKVTPDAAQRLRLALDPLQRVMEPANRRVLHGPSMHLPIVNGFDPDAMAAWLNDLWSNRQAR